MTTTANAPLSTRFKTGLVYTDGKTRAYIVSVDESAGRVNIVRLSDGRVGSIRTPSNGVIPLFGGSEPTAADRKMVDAAMADMGDPDYAWCPGHVAKLTSSGKKTASKGGLDPEGTYVVTKVNSTTVDVVPLGTTDGTNFLRMPPELIIPAFLRSTAVK